MNIYTSLIILGSVAVGLSAYLPFQIPNKSVSFVSTIFSSIFSLLVTYIITRRYMEQEHDAEIRDLKERYERKIRRLKKEHDTTTLEKTIREGTQTLIKNAVDYFKIENIKNEVGASAAIQNLQLDKYGQIIELLADFSLILPDYQENQLIVQRELDHQIEIYEVDEKPFSLFLQRIMGKYRATLEKKIREKMEQKAIQSMKSCPRCAERVLFKARVCKHCGYEFKNVPRSATHSTVAVDRVEKGKALFNAGNYEEAIEVFNSAIILKPNYALAYYNRAIVYNKLGDHQRAEADLKEACYLGHKKAQELLNAQGMRTETAN